MKLTADLRQVLSSPFSRRIFFRLTGCLLLFSLILFVIAMVIEYRNLSRELQEDGIQLTDIYAHAVRLGVFAEDKDLMRPPSEAVLKHYSVQSACAVSSDGRLLFKVGKTEEAARNCFQTLRNDPAMRKAVLLDGRRQSIEKDNWIQFWVPVNAEERPFNEGDLLLAGSGTATPRSPLGAVGILMDRSLIARNMRHLFLSYLLLTLLFILLGTLTTTRIAREAATPLKELLSRFTPDQEKEQLRHTDEIETISGTFDRLVQELSRSFHTISELKNGLEEKVNQRTAELAGRHRELLAANRQLEKTLKDLKDTQSQLVQSEKMAGLGHLVAGMAHEINNTINFISGALPSLRRTAAKLHEFCAVCGKAGKDLAREERENLFGDLNQLIDNISEGAARTAKIVRDLRDFSRPDRGELEVADLHQNIEATLALIRPEYKHRLEILKDFDERIGLVSCFPNQLNQVFMNILLNAIQAIDGKGTITITTRKQEDGIHIRFRDTGCGIPPELTDYIFDPFFTTKEVGKGTGLGLSISYSIIKNQHGEIRVESEPGKGTEFDIVLPG